MKPNFWQKPEGEERQLVKEGFLRIPSATSRLGRICGDLPLFWNAVFLSSTSGAVYLHDEMALIHPSINVPPQDLGALDPVASFQPFSLRCSVAA